MKYTASVKGGLHAQYAGTIAGVDANLIDRGTRRAAQGLDGKGQYATRKLTDTLLGAAPGANAQYTYPEIQASAELGGKRPVVQTNLVNRATTSQDVTDLKVAITTMSANTFVPSPPINRDRNPLGTR